MGRGNASQSRSPKSTLHATAESARTRREKGLGASFVHSSHLRLVLEAPASQISVPASMPHRMQTLQLQGGDWRRRGAGKGMARRKRCAERLLME